MDLIGSTAIESKIHNEVDTSILSLRKAGIKVCVFTKDKIESCINFAYSCKLFDNSFNKIIIDGESKKDVENSIKSAFKIVQQSKINNLKYGLILTNFALDYLDYQNNEQLFEIFENCESIIISTINPFQKYKFISKIRILMNNKITLAIGDESNDSTIILCSHIGVSLGFQLSSFSDLSIGKFKFLPRLLLYRGREFCRRNANLIHYNFFKNIVLVFPQFWFGFFSGFSGTIVHDFYIFQLFNILYTSLPIIIYALIDKEYKCKEICKNSYLHRDARFGIL